ncbi:hypothetical protein [Algoriphagus aquimarinus]|uniref:Uncharacterized protein n=1 Tax=Algoriphagus aquimarinus TaxID=237018 RepID=A0A1I1A6Y3_9BACT|nr:hypothetical protein [Algoriphagus aquimarinus]SFB33749.1 hypothetical protein SAMN04489723_107222 [Algoriphagus aquimarinus]
MEAIFRKLERPPSLLALVVLFALFNLLLNYFMPRELALDVRFAYSANEAYNSIQSMGPKVRENYLAVIWILDTAYMLVYLLLFSILIMKISKRKLLVILPLVIFILDLFENLMVTFLLLKFPVESQVLGFIASFFTTTKWLTVGAFCVIFIFCVIRNYVLKNQPDLKLNR